MSGGMLGRVAEIPKNANETLVVSLDEYRGHRLVSARVYYDDPRSGELIPTAKGIALQVTLLPQLVEAMTTALQRAREAGLVK